MHPALKHLTVSTSPTNYHNKTSLNAVAQWVDAFVHYVFVYFYEFQEMSTCKYMSKIRTSQKVPLKKESKKFSATVYDSASTCTSAWNDIICLFKNEDIVALRANVWQINATCTWPKRIFFNQKTKDLWHGKLNKHIKRELIVLYQIKCM